MEPGPLAVSDLSRLSDRLPAAARAWIQWAPQMIERALDRLLVPPLGDEVADCAADVSRALAGFWSALLAVSPDLDGLRGELRTSQDQKLRLILDRLDPASADAAEWAFRAMIKLGELFLEAMAKDPAGVQAVSPDDLVAAAKHPIAGGMIRAQVLLMAIVHAIENQRPVPAAHLEDLAYAALMNAAVIVDALQAGGLVIEPFPGESSAQRAARIGRYASHARSVLPEDFPHVVEPGLPRS